MQILENSDKFPNTTYQILEYSNREKKRSEEMKKQRDRQSLGSKKKKEKKTEKENRGKQTRILKTGIIQ